ncbi:MAG: hypothetical protein IJ984_03595 [Prevotella sp.]|nr:hypothetical protein [Prevotella sp.]
MNTINDKFSFARFAAVLKCDLVEHRWRYISVFFIMFVALLGCQLMHINEIIEWSSLRGTDSSLFMHRLAENCTAFFYVVLMFALICAAADMSSVPFKTKGRALNYLVMPASKLEKFLSRAFINIVLVIVMAYVALFLADLVRMLCVPFFEADGFYGFTVHQIFVNLFDPFKAVFENGSTTNAVIVNDEVLTPVWSFGMCFMAVVCIVLSGLWSHSVFLLGGCIWRKGALLKTIASAMIISLLVLWLLVNIAPSIDVWAENRLAPWLEQRFETEEDLLRVGFPIVAFLNLAFVVFNWWLAYRLFSRKQMISRTHLFGSKHPHHLFNKAHS